MSKRSQRIEDATGYQAIADDLRSAIRESRITVGSLLPTERELQEQFCVSRSTVRRALKALIESGWAESSPNRGVIAKHGPSVGRSTNIGYIDHGHEIQRYLFFKLGQLLQAQGYHLVHLDSELMGLEDAADYAENQGFCGVFVWSKTGFPNADRLQRVINKVPVIAVNHSLNTVSTDIVTADNFVGGQLATRHLGKARTRLPDLLNDAAFVHLAEASPMAIACRRNDERLRRRAVSHMTKPMTKGMTKPMT